MQQFKHNSSLPHIKEANAAAIADAILGIKSPTRSEISKRTRLTEMTVCRATSRLYDAGFIQENAPKNSARAAASLSVADNLRFIVIDMSYKEYTIYLMSSAHKATEKLSYTFNHSLDLSDNLSIFLERAKNLFSQKATHFSGIAIITDGKASSIRAINDAVAQSFGVPITAILEFSDCIQSIRTSAIESRFPSDNLYYLNLGNRNLAYFVTENVAIRSAPQILNDAHGNRLGERINNCISAEQLFDIIYSIVNSASAILDAKLFLIESDRFILGNNMGFSIAEKLKLKFGDRRKLLISDAIPPYYIKGASIALQKIIMKNILTK